MLEYAQRTHHVGGYGAVQVAPANSHAKDSATLVRAFDIARDPSTSTVGSMYGKGCNEPEYRAYTELAAQNLSLSCQLLLMDVLKTQWHVRMVGYIELMIVKISQGSQTDGL